MSTTQNLGLTYLTAGQLQPEVTVNNDLNILDAAAGVALQAFSNNAATTTGLTYGYFGGKIYSNGANIAIANGTIALAASVTNYVQRTAAGVVSVNTTGFTAGLIPMAQVTTGASTVTTIADARPASSDLRGRQVIAVAATNITLTDAQVNARILSFQGTLTANVVVTFPAYQQEWIVSNETTGAFTLQVQTAGGSPLAVLQGTARVIYGNGTLVKPAAGSAFLAGSGVPASGTGNDGDSYLDNASGLLYGPKAAGVWPGSPVDISAAVKTALAAPTGSALVGATATSNNSGLTVSDQLAQLGERGAMEPSSSNSKYGYDFTNTLKYAVGETPKEISLLGTATASINSSNQLSVVAPYNSANKAVLADTFAEGCFRVKLINGPFLVAFIGPDGNMRALWSSSGVNLEFGTITPNGVPTSMGSVAMPSAVGTIIFAELIIGPWSANRSALIRAWTEGTPRPSAGGPVTLNGSGNYNEGRIALLSMPSAAPAVYLSLDIFDAKGQGAQACGQASFLGRWFPRYEGNKLCMATTRGGSQFRCRTQGATEVDMRYAVPLGIAGGSLVHLDIYVDGVEANNVELSTVVGFTTINLVTGLTPTYHEIEVRVRGVNEANDKWVNGCALLVESLYSNGNGKIVPWPDNRPKALFIGDSITEGILARATPSLAVNSGGDLSYPVLACKALNLQPVVNAFGGTGMTVSGSGGMPSAPQNAAYYMAGRPIDTLNENIKFIVINLGTNDAGWSVATATFQAAYLAFLQSLLESYPSVQTIWAMLPLNGSYAAQIQAAVTAVGNERVAYLDTSTWTGITYTAPPHPDLAGHAKVAGYLITALGDLQPPNIG